VGTVIEETGRVAPIDIEPAEFRDIGHRLVDRLADFLGGIGGMPVTRGEEAAVVRAALASGGVPEAGADAGALVEEALSLMLAHSLFNGHPRFFGFITSSAAPIGAFADMIAAGLNPNVGGWVLSPMATEIEAQTVRWIAELLAYPTDCGGLLVSGGNVANMIGFWCARRAKLGWDLRAKGVLGGGGRQPRVYASRETHTWIEKAADLGGIGTDAIRWIGTDEDQRIDVAALRAQIERDRAAGDAPFMVVGSAGTVSTGAVDPLPELAALCRECDLWFHVDGAYGAPAVLADDVPADLRGLALADSVAMDPHKWLYAALEAGCVLVRDRAVLRDTFSFHPPYYPERDSAEDAPIFYHEYGPQNSRGFRALKVWLALRQVGRAGYARMIADDIALARALYDGAASHPELEAWTHTLSITTFRYIPRDLDTGRHGAEGYLDDLNRAIMETLQRDGLVFVTNAVIRGRFLLRACIVNFRTTGADIAAVPDTVATTGRRLDAELRPASLR
jgi:glutamate/tyrosine decarboxylase-like PLP-dependent enzyme